eukprot:602782-Pyramimonas_sp.AAC.1
MSEARAAEVMSDRIRGTDFDPKDLFGASKSTPLGRKDSNPRRSDPRSREGFEVRPYGRGEKGGQDILKSRPSTGKFRR